MTSFRYVPAGFRTVVVLAFRGGRAAGSVMVRDDGHGVISVARLHTPERFRRQGAARVLMEHVLWLYAPREAWLRAEPFTRGAEQPGAPAEVLERFYGSLGFMPAGGCPEPGLMVRHADLPSVPAAR